MVVVVIVGMKMVVVVVIVVVVIVGVTAPSIGRTRRWRDVSSRDSSKLQ